MGEGVINQKKTILLALGLNTALVAALFIGSWIGQEPPPKLALEKGEPEPLFDDSIDLVVRQELPPLPLPTLERKEVVHPLPTLETKQEVKPAEPPAPVVAVVPTPAPVAAPRTTAREVTVKKGESLEKIARTHHTTVEEIVRLNQLSSTFLKVGQTLKLPSSPPAEAAAPKKVVAPTNPEYYTVKVGDNPWTIAMKHHMKVEELLALNGLNEERARKLKPGDRLRIK